MIHEGTSKTLTSSWIFCTKTPKFFSSKHFRQISPAFILPIEPAFGIALRDDERKSPNSRRVWTSGHAGYLNKRPPGRWRPGKRCPETPDFVVMSYLSRESICRTTLGFHSTSGSTCFFSIYIFFQFISIVFVTPLNCP